MTRGILLAAGITLLSGAAMAGPNLVANPGFEGTGAPNLNGWTNTGDGIAVDTTFPNTGSGDAAFTAQIGDTSAGTLSQAIATTPGSSYTLSFYVMDEAGYVGDTFAASFGGFGASITGDQAAASYTLETYTIPSGDITGTLTTLSFQGLNDPSFGIAWNLDDVSLTLAAVPEPPAALLLAAALGGLALIGWRRHETV